MRFAYLRGRQAGREDAAALEGDRKAAEAATEGAQRAVADGEAALGTAVQRAEVALKTPLDNVTLSAERTEGGFSGEAGTAARAMAFASGEANGREPEAPSEDTRSTGVSGYFLNTSVILR